MRWNPEGPSVTPTYLGSLTPDSVLVEYEGPRVYTSHASDGRKLLVYQCDEADDRWRYLVVPFSDRLLDDLLSGRSTIVQSLRQPWAWLADIVEGDRVIGVWPVDTAGLPADYFPKPNVYLSPQGGPALSLRFIGDSFGEWTTPLSVMKYAAERATSATRELVAHVARTNVDGLWNQEHEKDLSDLPILAVHFASFEVDLGLPAAGIGEGRDSDVRRMVQDKLSDLFRRAFSWAADPAHARDPGRSDEESVAIMNALRELAPTGRTAVQEVEVGGWLAPTFGTKRVSLKKDLRPRIQAAITRITGPARRPEAAPKLIMASGLVTSATHTNRGFSLGQITQVVYLEEEPVEKEFWPFGETIWFVTDGELPPNVVDAFRDKSHVTVVGQLLGNRNSEATMADVMTPLLAYQMLILSPRLKPFPAMPAAFALPVLPPANA